MPLSSAAPASALGGDVEVVPPIGTWRRAEALSVTGTVTAGTPEDTPPRWCRCGGLPSAAEARYVHGDGAGRHPQHGADDTAKNAMCGTRR